MERTLSNISGRVKAVKVGKKHCHCHSSLLAEGWKRRFFWLAGRLCGGGSSCPASSERQREPPGWDCRWNRRAAAFGLSTPIPPLPLSSPRQLPLPCRASGQWAMAGCADGQADVRHWCRTLPWGALAARPRGWTALEFAKYLGEKGGWGVFLPWKCRLTFSSGPTELIGFFLTFFVLLTQFLALVIPWSYLVPTAARERHQGNLGRSLPNLCPFSLEKDGDKEVQRQSPSSRLLVLCFKPECLEAAIISVVSDLTGRAAPPDQRNTSKHYQNYDNSFI